MVAPDTLWLSVLLAFAAAAAWILSAGTRPEVRLCLRLSMTCYFALAVAATLPVSSAFTLAAVAPVVLALALPALALAVHISFRRPVENLTIVLFLASSALMGMSAAFSGEILVAEIPQFAAALVMLTISRRGLIRLRTPSVLLAAGTLSSLAAAGALLSAGTDVITALFLFSAAGALGVSLAVARISDTFVKKTRSVTENRHIRIKK